MNVTNASAIVLGGLGGIGKEISLKLIQRGVKVFQLSNPKFFWLHFTQLDPSESCYN